MEKYFHSNSNTYQNFTGASFSAGDSSTVYSSPTSYEHSLGNMKADCALFSSPYQTTSSAIDPSKIFSFLTNMPIQNDHSPSPKLGPVDLMENKDKSMELKIPKMEDIDLMEFGQVSAQSFSLFPAASTEYSSSGLLQLPNLCYLEEVVHKDSELVTESYLKRLKSSLSPAPYTADYLFSDFQLPEFFHSPAATAANRELIRQREVSLRKRLRNQKIREKLDCLKKLLPSEKKMDTTATLEMAYKYIKFLQTQISILEAMPRDCLPTVSTSTQDLNNFQVVAGTGESRMMSRNELLQILVNSPAIQTIMCSQGLCVYSIEQLVEIIGRLFTTEEAFLIFNSMVFSP